MKQNKLIILFLLFASTCIWSQTIKVSNIKAYNKAIKKAKPGSVIQLANGIWKDVKFNVYGQGNEKQPITIEAETAGKVIFSGDAKLTIYGQHIIVKGLWFKNGLPKSTHLISFSKSENEYATHCRLTDCAITDFNPTDSKFKSHWISLHGKNNRVDHCYISGKKNAGTTLVVWLNEKNDIENNHTIDHNFFGERTFLGYNGGETIRVGTSEFSMSSSKTLVDNNVFRHCNGEIEIISNKSCDNIYKSNLFVECEGTLTLRHGKRALVENNVFLGNKKENTGGIRIIDEGHVVRNNLLVGLTGNELKSPISLMNGMPNPPLNRYFQVKNVDVQNNTIIDCNEITIGAGKDDERSLPPINSVIANNLIFNDNNKNFEIKDMGEGVSFFGNIVDSNTTVDPKYAVKTKIDWDKTYFYAVPSLNNKDLIVSKKTVNTPTFDLTQTNREQHTVGALNLGNKILPDVFKNVPGPNWLVSENDERGALGWLIKID
jgi:poly(beta-D-mannuronate) lyase